MIRAMSHRERFFAALRGWDPDRIPVAPLLTGLAADRAGISFREFATNGKALANAQFLVQERLGLDAITAGSDGLRVSADLGGEVIYPKDSPPHLNRPLITSLTDPQDLGRPDPTQGRMGDRVLAVAEMVRAVGGQVAVLGWIGMPYAEVCHLFGLTEFMLLMKSDPNRAHRILAYVTNIVVDFALAQLEVGAHMIGASDPAAVMISPKMYEEFVLPYERIVCSAIHDAGSQVKLHICGNTSHLLDRMVRSGADLFNVDHLVPLGKARDVYARHGRCFKGNLDPVAHIMQATPDECRARAHDCIAIAPGTRYVLSAGCCIPAQTPEDVLRAFCDAPKTYRQRPVS